MSNRIGIIDCGTNTFNLLVGEPSADGKIEVIFKNKIPVKLAPSATTGVIGKNRFARGIDALFVHKNTLTNLGVTRVFAFATSAIRDSANGAEFVENAKSLVGLDLKVISGEEEAELIHKGVIQTIPEDFGPFVIMDIGGGSVEFVIGSKTELIWLQSLKLGVSRLKGQIQPNDPIDEGQITELKELIKEQTQEVVSRLKENNITKLVGSSGSFDSIEKMLGIRPDSEKDNPADLFELDAGRVKELHNHLLTSTLADRLGMKGLVPMRADMIVMALILIHEIVELASIERIYHSEYALKEGAFYNSL
jgi:exopolyphosphatase/guanosine-5'-triphosphate,3'-diphosphate pyrophosphatase